MVVITAFLLKAAYERYNSSSDNNNNISASEHTRDTNTNNYPTQTLRRINSSPDRLNSYQRRVNSTNNNTIHRVVNGRIYKTRRSSSIRNNNRRSTASSKSNSSRHNFRNIMTIETKEEEVIIPTKYGYFVINPKTKVISLPPETTIPSNNTANSNNDTSRRDGDNAIIKLDFETPSKLPTTTTINNNGIIQNNPSIVTEAPTVATDKTRAINENTYIQGIRDNNSYTINNTNTTFRNDIRNDWVDAIFGKDFFPLQTNINDKGVNNGGLDYQSQQNNRENSIRRDNIGIKQGTGAAGISHYVTYGAILDPNSAQNSTRGPIKTSYSGGGNSSTATPSSSKVQSKTQSTPLIFASPSSSSLLNNTSLVSAACGGAVTTPADIINYEEEEGATMQQQQHGFETPLPNNGMNNNSGAKYTIEGTIPPPPSTRNTSSSISSPKLGITISRIPIALYVQSISTHSEAYTVGISPGSILVEINGLGMLGERSDRALERLWMYTGLFSSIDYNNNGNGEEGGTKKNQESMKKSKSGTNLNNGQSTTTNASSNNNNTEPQDLQMKKPLLLKFYKSGRTYTTLLLSGKPLQGINWAPVGNFALVHKVSSNSIAAEAGVRRGTLVVGVGSSSSDGRKVVEGLRTLDHGGVARILKDRFSNGESITLSMGYTPAASRSGYHEREEKMSSNNQIIDGRKTPPPPASSTSEGGGGMLLSRSSNNSSNSIRDVEVRSRPVEYSSAMVETFFACTGPGAMSFVDEGEGGMNGRDNNNPKRMMSQNSSSFRGSSARDGSANNTTNAAGIAEVAAYVAAGGILPPGGILEAASTMTRQLQTSSMNNNTGGSSSRRLSLADTPKNFTPCPTLPQDELLLEWNSLSSLARSMAYQSSGSYCETTYIQSGGPFERITKYDGEEHTVGGEAPFTPTECMGMIWSIANSGISSTSPKASPVVVAAEDVFDSHLLQLLGVTISPKMGAVEKGQRLSEMLLDIVIDVALNDINLCQRLFFLLRSFIGELEEQKVPHGYISEQSALAMRCCRYAQRRLSGRMFDKSVGIDGEKERHCSEGYPISRESSRTKQQVDFSKLSIAASESSIGHHNTNGTLSSLGMDDNINLRETGAVQELTESSSDLPGAVSSSSLIDQIVASTSQSEEQDGVIIPKKKKKSKKILRMLKGGKSKKTLSSDQSNAAPSTITGAASSGESSKKSPKASSKSFFPKFSKSASLETIDDATPPVISVSNGEPESISLSSKFENMASILRQLDNSCSTIERNLMKSFSQKMADWALYPWSESKESALASVTQSFRSELRLMNPRAGSSSSSKFPILNPVDSTELLTSVDADECFILPSAHFPLLLCFNSEYNVVGSPKACAISSSSQEGGGSNRSRVDTLYRTKVEVVGLHSTFPLKVKEAFSIQGGIAGVVQESGVSDVSKRSSDSSSFRWTNNNTLLFETRSSWGSPKTLSLKVSSVSKPKHSDGFDEESRSSDVGCGFVDLCPIWVQQVQGTVVPVESKTKVHLFDSSEVFDQHGQANDLSSRRKEAIELHLRISTEVVTFEDQPRKRLLLYKHGDDLRQELLAIQFIERCNQILIASGLDLKLKTFSCQPVGSKTGFIEWVRGTVPLSELCKSSGSSQPDSNVGIDSRQSSRSKDDAEGSSSEAFNTALDVSGKQVSDGSSRKSHRWFKYDSLPGLHQRGSVSENPIQDFLRSAAYDKSAPYFVKKEVMATYVKSCAGYCVITYLLGVGDRHLDNILLHQNGHLLHCDYSFILGQDPKTYLPMRITEEMIKGFGGRDSDNFAKFLVFTGAAFITLRRHSNIHSLLSHINNMVHAGMGDLSINQPPEEAILAMRGRFRLDLSDDDAMAYIEDVVEKSITSKMWRAVDVMHSLGKHF